MLRFFRKIRQKLWKERHLKTYLVYIFGEILLVVVGILLALQINNWNESRKQAAQRKVLIQALLDDFEDTQQGISEALALQQSIVENNQKFLTTVYFSRNYEALDSIQNTIRSFFRTMPFTPNLTTYQDAQSSGKISLLDDKNLLFLFADFFNNLERLNQFRQIAYELNFLGSTWEIKKNLGFLSKLYKNPGDVKLGIFGRHEEVLSTENYIALLHEPYISAGLENISTLNRNLLARLQALHQNTERILQRLQCMLDELECLARPPEEGVVK